MIRRLLFYVVLLAAVSCTNEELGSGENCFDGVKNQDEVGVDCGGRCPFGCPPEMTAAVNGTTWIADTGSVTANYTAGSQTMKITGSPSSGVYPRIQLVYVGPLSIGSHPLDPATSYLPNLSAFMVFNSGTLNITSVDTRNRLVYGGFSFTSTDTASMTVYNVTNGQFRYIAY